MSIYPFDMPDDELEAEGMDAEGESVYVLKDGSSVALNVPDDVDGEEDHDNVDYD